MNHILRCLCKKTYTHLSPEERDEIVVLALKDIGKCFEENSNRYDEGIQYFYSVSQRFPGSQTAFSALVQKYNLEMTKGDIAAAAITQSTIELDKLTENLECYNRANEIFFKNPLQNIPPIGHETRDGIFF